jgi:hypothetical protein
MVSVEPIWHTWKGVQWRLRRLSAALQNSLVVGDGGDQMAKGQVRKEKSNKPKLSPKEKKTKKAEKEAAKDRR